MKSPREPKVGTLVAIEGVTGVGKTYFADRLETAIREVSEAKVVRMGGFKSSHGEEVGDITRFIKQLILASRFIGLPWLCETTLLLSEQAYNLEMYVAPAHKEGSIILYENYNDALVAYQLARCKALGLNAKQMLQVLLQLVNLQFDPFGYPREDFVVYLSAPLNTIYSRLKARDGQSVGPKDRDLIRDIRASYVALYKGKPVEEVANNGDTDLTIEAAATAREIISLRRT